MRQLLSDAIDDYDKFRASQDRSKRTRYNDRCTLKALLTSAGNIYCHNLSDRHVTDFLATRSLTRSTNALRLDHVILNTFFGWARHTARMPRTVDPMIYRSKPKKIERERERIHVSKFPSLLDCAGERCARDRAIMAVALYTLLRASEMKTLRVGHLDLDAGYIKARIHKGKTEDRVPISAELDAELRRWLPTYAGLCGELQPEWALLPVRMKRPVQGENGRFDRHEEYYLPNRAMHDMYPTVKPILERFGFAVVDDEGKATQEGAHTLRRSGARALFDSLSTRGYDNALRVVQAMLHHKSIVQTEHYIGISADRKSRDDLIRGQVMYPGAAGDNVTRLEIAR